MSTSDSSTSSNRIWSVFPPSDSEHVKTLLLDNNRSVLDIMQDIRSFKPTSLNVCSPPPQWFRNKALSNWNLNQRINVFKIKGLGLDFGLNMSFFPLCFTSSIFSNKMEVMGFALTVVLALENCYSPSRAAGHHQYPLKRSNSSWVTKVATPADFGSSFRLPIPERNKYSSPK